jgi:hypothetical protein
MLPLHGRRASENERHLASRRLADHVAACESQEGRWSVSVYGALAGC